MLHQYKFNFYHQNQFKVAFVTQAGPDWYMFTSTNQARSMSMFTTQASPQPPEAPRFVAAQPSRHSSAFVMFYGAADRLCERAIDGQLFISVPPAPVKPKPRDGASKLRRVGATFISTRR